MSVKSTKKKNYIFCSSNMLKTSYTYARKIKTYFYGNSFVNR